MRTNIGKYTSIFKIDEIIPSASSFVQIIFDAKKDVESSKVPNKYHCIQKHLFAIEKSEQWFPKSSSTSFHPNVIQLHEETSLSRKLPSPKKKKGKLQRANKLPREDVPANANIRINSAGGGNLIKTSLVSGIIKLGTQSQRVGSVCREQLDTFFPPGLIRASARKKRDACVETRGKKIGGHRVWPEIRGISVATLF